MDTTARALSNALLALKRINDAASLSTLTWMEQLGEAVNERGDVTLAEFRQRLEEGSSRPLSSGYLSRAATVHTHLVAHFSWMGTAQQDILEEIARHPQASIYRAALAVRDGHLNGLQEALSALNEGRFKERGPQATREAPDGDGDRAPFDEVPAPGDDLARQVYEAALVGARAAGLDVLEWVRAQAGLAVLRAA
jgi:hypothetical protein